MTQGLQQAERALPKLVAAGGRGAAMLSAVVRKSSSHRLVIDNAAQNLEVATTAAIARRRASIDAPTLTHVEEFPRADLNASQEG